MDQHRQQQPLFLSGQAEVIEKIASQGRDGFIVTSALMVETLRSLGGHRTEDDFANARAGIPLRFRDVWR